MKNFLSISNYLVLAFFSLFILSCDSDDDDGQEMEPEMEANIVATAQNTEALSSLVAALVKADENANSDLVGTLSAEGNFTVFAPTNEAFTALLAGLDGYDSLEDFDTEEEKALLGKILQYHVVAGTAAASTDLSDGQTITTVQGESVSVSLTGGVFIGDATETDAEVVIADVMASNGIVHVIDKVLLPQEVLDALMPEEEGQDLVEIVVESETLTVLEAAVIKADLVATLQSDGPFTVFAPTDDAFIALLEALGDDYNSLDDFDTEEEIALLKDILLYHVVPAQVLAADLAAGTVGTALTDNSIEVIASGETFVIGDASDANANITGTDIMATNGVAHTIDKVLLPQAAIDFVASLNMKNIVELAQETDDLSVLVDALVKANAGLVDTLSGEGPFTVFAPTNAAFVALLEALGDDYNSLDDFDTEEEVALLVDILTYHVIAGTEAFSTDLTDGQMLTTVSEDMLTVNLTGGVFIADATDMPASVVTPDVDASNGVVHIIDKVLLPQAAVDFVASLHTPNIPELAMSVDDLSLLVDALVQADAGLVEALSGEGPFTVFAPTNAAFAALLDSLGSEYNSLADFDTAEEKALLAKILTYHVVSGAAVTSGQLTNGQMVTTLQTETITIDLSAGVQLDDKTDTNANVTGADNEASNGVVHIIDKVLLPQEVIDALHG
ncbi:fasciclin domain-containing protein [Croceivirga sp. JEA036]|uniref:fasciclin domain-containing protein n=1 Tax=Croceivirga sp. JEA036 TaxID=2721162 RepID=UPI00143C9A44|nr:fasciclin domain-containing protein [Croceivirga sp. JEA036]NJB34972.1 fasciclin [Croceivirga sp. JEA036]